MKKEQKQLVKSLESMGFTVYFELGMFCISKDGKPMKSIPADIRNVIQFMKDYTSMRKLNCINE